MWQIQYEMTLASGIPVGVLTALLVVRRRQIETGSFNKSEEAQTREIGWLLLLSTYCSTVRTEETEGGIDDLRGTCMFNTHSSLRGFFSW